jgi:hypothetical protein
MTVEIWLDDEIVGVVFKLPEALKLLLGIVLLALKNLDNK